MPRVTFSLSDLLHNMLLSVASEKNQSISQTIAQLLQVGLYHLDETNASNAIEIHCQQLIIQMNALIKRLAVEMLKFDHQDFDELQQAVLEKYNEIHK